MEEKIFEILELNRSEEDVDGYYTAFVTNLDQSAQEITEHIMEFIGWKDSEGLFVFEETTALGKLRYRFIYDEERFFDLSDVYAYWIKNIKTR